MSRLGPHDGEWRHPLIRTLDRPLSRRLLAIGVAGLALGSRRPELRLVSAGTPVATPGSRISGDAEAVALLEEAAAAMAALETFAFELETTRGASTILQGFELRGISGVVRRPADIQAVLTVGVPFGELEITAIGLDGNYWVEDPLAADGAWIELGRDLQLQSLINPDALILAAVRLVQNARIAGTEKVDGVATTVVEGTVDVAGTVGAFAGDSSEAAQLIADGAREIVLWIDDRRRIVEVEIVGPLLTTESDDVVRVVRFFEFDEPVEIEAPPTPAP